MTRSLTTFLVLSRCPPGSKSRRPGRNRGPAVPTAGLRGDRCEPDSGDGRRQGRLAQCHFPNGKQELAAAVVDAVGGEHRRQLRGFLADETPVADVVDGWIDVLIAGLASDPRDDCPVEPIATEAVHASQQVREASTRVFSGWCDAVADRLRKDGWGPTEQTRQALAVISLIEGALRLSRVASDAAALDSAKLAAHLRAVDGRHQRSARVICFWGAGSPRTVHAGGMTANPQRIDVHHHILPPDFVSALNNLNIDWTGGPEVPKWSHPYARKTMEQTGIAAVVASVSPGVYWGGDTAFAVSLARDCNGSWPAWYATIRSISAVSRRCRCRT